MEKVNAITNPKELLSVLHDTLEKLSLGEIAIDKSELISKTGDGMINCSIFNLKTLQQASKSGEFKPSSNQDFSGPERMLDPKLQSFYLAYGELLANIYNNAVSIDGAKKLLKELNKKFSDYKKSLILKMPVN